MSSLSGRAALLIVANSLKYAIGFLLPMLLVRLLTTTDYGTYQQLSLVSNLSLGVMVLGLPMSIYYFYHQSSRATLIAQTQAILLASGLLAALALAAGSAVLAAALHNPQLRLLLPPYAIFVGLMIAGEHFLPVMISQDRYRLAVGLELLETIVRVGILIPLLALGATLAELVTMLVAFAGLRLLGRSYWLWRGADSLRYARWRERFPSVQLAYSLPLAASACIGQIGGMLDRGIVALAFTPAVYAIYSVGALEIPLDVIFQASVANVLRASLPPLARAGRLEEIVQIWRNSVRKLGLVIVPSFVFLLCFSEPIITTLFTRRYRASVPVFRIYLCVMPLYMLVLNAVPQVFGRTRVNLYVVAITVASNVILSLMLLRMFGVCGPALGFACSSYLAAGLYFAFTVRLLRTTPARLLPLASLARTATAAGLALAPSLACHELFSGAAALLAAGVSFAMAYVAAGYAAKIFSRSDIASARALVHRMVPGMVGT